MASAWSFGRYNKKEAIAWSFELFNKVWGFPADRLHGSYYDGDDGIDQETMTYWKNHLPAINVKPHNEPYFSVYEDGPNGPISTISFDTMRVGNLFFIEYKGDENIPKSFVLLEICMERIVTLLQRKKSSYDTDMFSPYFKKIQELTGTRAYTGRFGEEDKDGVDKAYRVLADHVRTLSIVLADGGRPDNSARGAVLKKIIQRAVEHGQQKLNMRVDDFTALVDVVVESLGDCFPELKKDPESTKKVLKEEWNRIFKTEESDSEGSLQIDESESDDGNNMDNTGGRLREENLEDSVKNVSLMSEDEVAESEMDARFRPTTRGSTVDKMHLAGGPPDQEDAEFSSANLFEAPLYGNTKDLDFRKYIVLETVTKRGRWYSKTFDIEPLCTWRKNNPWIEQEIENAIESITPTKINLSETRQRKLCKNYYRESNQMKRWDKKKCSTIRSLPVLDYTIFKSTRVIFQPHLVEAAEKQKWASVFEKEIFESLRRFEERYRLDLELESNISLVEELSDSEVDYLRGSAQKRRNADAGGVQKKKKKDSSSERRGKPETPSPGEKETPPATPTSTKGRGSGRKGRGPSKKRTDRSVLEDDYDKDYIDYESPEEEIQEADEEDVLDMDTNQEDDETPEVETNIEESSSPAAGSTTRKSPKPRKEELKPTLQDAPLPTVNPRTEKSMPTPPKPASISSDPQKEASRPAAPERKTQPSQAAPPKEAPKATEENATTENSEEEPNWARVEFKKKVKDNRSKTSDTDADSNRRQKRGNGGSRRDGERQERRYTDDRAPRRDGDASQRQERRYTDDRAPRRGREPSQRREKRYTDDRAPRGERRYMGDRAPRREGRERDDYSPSRLRPRLSNSRDRPLIIEYRRGPRR